MQTTTYSDVVNFLSDALSADTARMGPHTRLRQDLGLNTENADELFRDFAYAFRVDMTGFRVGDYVSDVKPPPRFVSFFLWLTGNARPLKTLTVADLVRAADNGALR